jgi:NAD(P)-dependent dehydrogenase (short-subunit alcohol dehydrogenase family)
MSARPVTLVTGARRGIGRAIAEALAKAGHDLALFNREPGAETEAACREATGMTAGVAAPYDARIATGLVRARRWARPRT